nr:MAG: hypothetical protein DIU70_04665 [Bacillota bacterium]
MDGMVRDVRQLFHRLHRDPSQFPLFARIWEVLQMAPSSRHASEEELVSLAADALDYLLTDGQWATASTTGRTELRLAGDGLEVYEEAPEGFQYRRRFPVALPRDWT